MRIAQITPGVLPIPPDGWGAVEKIIWEYTKVLRDLGHTVEILYTDQIKQGEWDIVHVHMANLALILRDRGIPYVFSHHDHHAFHFGKDSGVYRENREAILGSVFSFVHAKYLVEYFDVPGKIRYLGHGANLNDYPFEDRSADILQNGPKLLLMANNGLGGNELYDRKGFGPAIEAARTLNLPITIICRSEGNKSLIEKLPAYERLNVVYDLNYFDSIEELKKHNIFLNPSMLEAGHPNLTVTEAISLGIPVASTCEKPLRGIRKILSHSEFVDPNEIIEAISEIQNSYSKFVLECKKDRNMFSWEVVVSRMLMDYAKYAQISQKKLLLDSYQTIKKRLQPENQQPGFYAKFARGPHLYKARETEVEVGVSFIDDKTGRVVYKQNIGIGPRTWTSPADSLTEFIEWKIVVRKGSQIVFEEKMDLRKNHVFITGTSDLTEVDVKNLNSFAQETGCYLTIDSINPGVKAFYLPNPNEVYFYRILNLDQVRDFFTEKPKAQERLFIRFLPAALGDNLAFMPYLNELGKKRDRKIYVNATHRDLFTGVYDYIEFVDDIECTEYMVINYIFGLPLQKGFADQLGVDFKEIRPKVRPFRKKDTGIKGKYICFSTHSTCQAKFWNNNQAWMKLCDEFSKLKILPVCIDRFKSFGIEGHWNEIPPNCVDRTGGDLDDMMNLISGCEFFVGLSSGLSWVAHALGKKVVMISGVTSPDNEFTEDCLRIHRTDVCNSCFGKPYEHKFDPGNWLWCPIHGGTAREFECTKKISAKQVMDKILDARWLDI